MSNKKHIAPFQTRALLDPASYDETAGTVEVVVATNNPILRRSYDIGDFMEILTIDKRSIRMGRMNNGAPLLDNHNRNDSTRKIVLGSVQSASIVGNELRAVIKLSNREDMAGTRADIKDGIIRSISVGYRVFKYDVTENAGSLPTYTAIDWEPYEVSLVPVPDDPAGSVRSHTDNENEVEIINTRSMKIEGQEGAESASAAAESAAAPAAAAAPATTEKPAAEAPAAAAPAATAPAAEAPVSEGTRASEILLSAEKAGVPMDFVRSLVDDKSISVSVARQRIIEKLTESQSGANTRSMNTAASVRVDERDKKREVELDALVLRAMPELYRGPNAMPEDRIRAAEQIRGLSLLDLAKEAVKRTGVDTDGMNKMELVGRAFTSSSSDFPVLLEGTNRRVLLAGYNNASDTWRRIATVGSVGDFREYSRLRMGSFGVLDTVNENQEYKNKAIPDAEKEKISAKTKGNLVNVTRVMIVNDDLQAFTRIAQMLGRAAARSIETDFYNLLTSNGGNGPTMGDGVALFDAAHGNIATTGGVPSVTTFEKMMQQMAVQMDPSKNDFIDIRPEIWLGPLAISGDAQVLNDAQYDVSVSNKFQVPNRVRGMFKDVVGTPRLTGNPWYAFANPAEEPVFEVVFLDGQQAPHLESRQGFNIDGMEWKIRLDYGVGAIGWRGVIKNLGV